MPTFSGKHALALLKETNIDIPLIIVSGTVGEETAIECMRSGAHDYIMKDSLSRLCPAIARELEETKVRNKQRQADEALRKSEENFRLSLDDSPLGVRIVSAEGKTIYANQAVLDIYGYDSIEEINKTPIKERYTPQSYAGYKIRKEKRERGELGPPEYEISIVRKNGEVRHLLAFRKEILWSGVKKAQIIYQDITERKRIEDKLRQSEEKYRSILENIEDGYYEVELAGNFTFFNASMCRILGYSPEEMMGMNNRQFTDKENAKKLFITFNEVYKTGESTKEFNWQIIRQDGTKRYIEVSVSLQKNSSGQSIGFKGIARDITERKQAAEALRNSEANYKQLFDNAPSAIYQIDFRTGKFLKANDVICKYFGCSKEEITSLSPSDLLTKKSQKLFLERLNKMAIGDTVPEDPEFEFVDKDGNCRWLKLNCKNIYDSEGLAGADVVAHEITERKKMEETLRQSEERYRTILDEMADAYFEVDVAGNYTFLNDACCRHLGYPREELIGTTFRGQVAKEDINKIYDTCAKIFRTGKPEQISSYKIIRKDKTTGYTKMTVFPLKNQQEEIIGLRGVGQDVTESKRAEEERKQSFERLRKALGATVHSISTIVEMKDPYTAGHQQRVSDLARSIAKEMGLSENQRDFIRTAAAIHDIGKISIPSEILSKPTKLTDLEFNLIKTHAQSGYDILKDIEFPWPVADVVRQHHERMDGSGYPQGLKGNDILLEARIMGVADVVEAIASHRPYRPSLGIDFALDDISRNKGILYDAAVVDACLKLFREKGYNLVLKKL